MYLKRLFSKKKTKICFKFVFLTEMLNEKNYILKTFQNFNEYKHQNKNYIIYY
jgi:hypothetical protein